MTTLLWIIIAAGAIVIAWAVGAYNSLVGLRIRSDEAWSDIDVQLKRRYDLIPNLIETVKGYAKHEKNLFESVTAARTAAMGARTVKAHEKAENMLTEALKSVFAVAENYPQLKASKNFSELQAELTDTENKIEASRRFYNANVRDYNTKRLIFPSNLVASMFNFAAKELFEIGDESQRENPQVKF